MIHEFVELICSNTIETLEHSYKTEEEQLKNIESVMESEWEGVITNIDDDIDRNHDYIMRQIKWHIADKFKDDRLIDDLINEEQAEGERRLDEYLSSLE